MEPTRFRASVDRRVLFAAAALLGTTTLALASSPRPRVAVAGGAGSSEHGITIEKAFVSECPAVQVTAKRAAADYVFRLDHRVWRLDHWNHDRWDLMRPGGDIIAGGAAKTIGRAVRQACAAIAADRAAGAAGKTQSR